jgi:hypothetical protein
VVEVNYVRPYLTNFWLCEEVRLVGSDNSLW